MNEDQKDRLGRLADRIDNLTHAMALPLPDSVHLQALRDAMPELRDELKAIYVEVTGENPWEE